VRGRGAGEKGKKKGKKSTAGRGKKGGGERPGHWPGIVAVFQKISVKKNEGGKEE